MSAPPSDLTSGLSVIFEGTSLIQSERILIDNATGLVRAGRLTAVVSACGNRGDLMMLKLLAGLEQPSSGTMLANCVPVSSNTYTDSVAFVRTALLVPAAGISLTVYDNLLFALRMRCNLSTDEAQVRILRVLHQLQLEDITDIPVSQLSRIDQVKLSIATELVRCPDFLFIDFAFGEVHDTPKICDVLQLLSEISKEEQTIIAVALVQPRWLLLEYFDDVLLMEHSRLYYCGTRESLLPLLYEAEQQRPNSFSGTSNLPTNASLLGANENNNSSQQQQSQYRHPEACLNSLYIICASTRSSDLLEPPGFSAARTKTATDVAVLFRETANGRITMFEPGAAARSAAAATIGTSAYGTTITASAIAGVVGNSSSNMSAGSQQLSEGENTNSSPNFIVKLFYMTLYGLYRLKEDFVRTTVGFLLSFAAFLLLGKIYGNVMTGNTPASASETQQNGTGLLFFFVSLAFLYNVLHIEPFRDQLRNFQQQRAQGYYGGALFMMWLVLSNAVAYTLFCGLILLGVFVIDPLLGFAGLQHLVVVLGVVSFSTLGVTWAVISLFPTSKQLTVTVFVATYGVSALFGGLFINLLSLPEALRKISRISLIRLGYEAAIVGQFSGNSLGCNTTATTTTTTTTTTQAPSSSSSSGSFFSSLFSSSNNNNNHYSSEEVMQQQQQSEHDHSDLYDLEKHYCMTGDAYIQSVGFDVANKWENLLPLVYIWLCLLALTAFGLFYNRKTF